MFNTAQLIGIIQERAQELGCKPAAANPCAQLVGQNGWA